jgi:FkbM family methyltransferase
MYIRRENYRLRFHPTSLSCALWESPEGWNRDSYIIRSILRERDTFVDVGANIGHLSIEAGLIVGERGHVYAFEAHPRIAMYLRENVAINRLNNVNIAQIAIGDIVGWVGFSERYSDDQNEVTHAGPIHVLMLPLDLLLPNAQVTLLKVDTEGYEWYVFKGAESLLKRTSFVYFEVWKKHMEKHGLSFAAVFDLLSHAGFHMGEYRDGALHLVTRETEFDINTNLLAYRSEQDLVERTGWRILKTKE